MRRKIKNYVWYTWRNATGKEKFSPFTRLKNALCEDGDKVEALEQYLKKDWYRGHRSSGWYDSHKSTQNTYRGYWSFEAGAVAKVLGLPDEKLKGLNYYPYDMVHYSDTIQKESN